MAEPNNAAVGGIKSTQEERRKLTKNPVVPPIGNAIQEAAAGGDSFPPTPSSRNTHSTTFFIDAINRGDFDSVLAEVRHAIRKLKCAIDEGKIMKKISTYNKFMRKIVLKALSEKSFSIERQNRIAHELLNEGIFEIFSKYWSMLEVKDASRWLETEHDNEWGARVLFIDYVLDATLGCITICDADYLKTAYEKVGFFCFDILRSPALRDFKQSTVQESILQKTLSSIHVLAQKYQEFCEWMRENDCASVVFHYMPHPALLVKTEAILLSSRIVSRDEEERKKIRDDLIVKAVGMLRDCLKDTSKTHHSATYGYKALDVLKVLNRLAENDLDKSTVAECGGLQLYGQLLADDCDILEQKEACNGLWILAFDEKNKRLIKQDNGCVQGLRKLCSSNDSAVKRAANGALWVVENEDLRVQQAKAKHENKTPDTSTNHSQTFTAPSIMISYSWKHKAEVLRIKNRLQAAGYSIWIDEEQMSGSTVEAMADAVEQAAVVLVCYSEHYKASHNCRSEAEYCYKLQKPCIPILLQLGYKAEGWLGLIFGTHLYYDFTRDETWESKFDSLCKDLNKLVNKKGDSTDRTASVTEPLLIKETDNMHQSAPHSAESWTANAVQKWLKDHGLVRSSSCFTGFTGAHIVEMHHMQKSAPSFFYKLLQKKLQLPVKELVTLSMLLRKLK